jgi:hypothetical protein
MGNLFGGKDEPEVDYTPVEIVDDKKKASAQRSQLLRTAAGISGEELQSGQTTKRENIFGN